VLVDDVHLVKDEQGTIDRVGRVIRLKLLDQAANSDIGNSLYFAFVSENALFIDWQRFADRKFDLPKVWSTPVSVFRQLPNQMVETGPQVVNNFPCENTEPRRNGAFLVVLDSLKKNLLVVLGEDGVIARLKESSNLGLEIQDVLVGTF
jgi:hypothetical protein